MCGGGGAGSGSNGDDMRSYEEVETPAIGPASWNNDTVTTTVSPKTPEGPFDNTGHFPPPKRNIIQKVFDTYDDMNPLMKVGANLLTGGLPEGYQKAFTIGNVLNKANDYAIDDASENEIDRVRGLSMYDNALDASSNLSEAFSNMGNPLGKSVSPPSLGTSAEGGWGKSLTTGVSIGGSVSPMGGMNWGTNGSATSGTIGQNIIAGSKSGLIDPISGLAVQKDTNGGFGKGFN